MRRNAPPHREPGKRAGYRQGARPKKRGERGARRPAPAQAKAPRAPADPVICRGAAGYEDADFLQRSAEGTRETAQQLGFEPLFGVSGWIVSGPVDPLPEGYTRQSVLYGYGFAVIPTPELGRRGHVTILLVEPVDNQQAYAFNAAFGRFGGDS